MKQDIFGRITFAFTIYFRLEEFMEILRSLQSPEDLNRKFLGIMEIIETDGKDMFLREPYLLKFIVEKAPLLIASPLYTEIMQVEHLFFSTT